MSGADESTYKRPARAPAAVVHRRPALTVLAHPDPSRVGELAFLAQAGPTRLSRLEPELAPPGGGAGRPLADRHLSRKPLRIEPSATGITLTAAAEGSPARVDGRPLAGMLALELDRLDDGIVIELADRVALLLHRRAPPRMGPMLGLVGASDALARLCDDLVRVADLRVPVCLLGETGTGKERAAEVIHRESGRTGAFVAVNMAAVPASTAVSQLFGHVRGAFTGADAAHRGLFAAASGGTLLLDEVADCADDVQAMLLRVLETSEVVPLGGEGADQVDVRLIAATDRDLAELVRAGRFRAPLWHRIAGYVITVPPLRARRDDIARLLHHFLADELATAGEPARLVEPDGDADPWLPASVVAAACRYDWPGNLRELRNVARHLVVASRGLDELVIDDEVAARLGPVVSGEPAVDDASLPAALERHGWRIGATAEALGISRTTLYARMEACPGIRKAGDVPAGELVALIAETGRDLDAMVARLRVSRRGLQLRLRELAL